MKILNAQDKKKKTKYIIASIVAILILFLWVSLPLLDRSDLNGGGGSSYGMQKKSADLALLDSGGIEAPGQPLNGSMIDNPATSLDLEASSLFKMPDTAAASENEAEKENTADAAGTESNVRAPEVTAPGSAQVGVKGRLNRMPSLGGGGGGGSMTVGSNHSKFFGQENAKADFVPLNENSANIKSAKGNNFALDALKHTERNSVMASNAKNADSAKSSAAGAFEKTQKFDDSVLDTKDEKEYKNGGVDFAKSVDDLKKSDPSLSKKKVALPQPSKDEDESQKMEEQMKQMLLQMIIQATIGQVFGAIGQMMSMQMCPQCYQTKPASNG